MRRHWRRSKRDGLRAWKQSTSQTGGVKRYFLYDGSMPLIELDSTGAVAAVNTYGPDGLACRTSGGSTVFYSFDQQGNLSGRTDASGNILTSSGYAAFGYSASFATSQSGSFTDPFGYNAQWGYYLDREHSYYLCGHRYYDHDGGRWLTRDPIGFSGGINLYSYCGQGPVGFADPSGLMIIGDFDFNPETIGGGMRTGLAALGSAFSFGAYDGGEERFKPGFGASKMCGEVARECLITAGTMGAGEAFGAARATREVGQAAEAATEAGRVMTNGGYYAYTLVDGSGTVRYVGQTNNIAVRVAQHMRDPLKAGLELGEQFTCASREEARLIEQLWIEQHGGVKGGQLLNRINSIARSNPLYGRIPR